MPVKQTWWIWVYKPDRSITHCYFGTASWIITKRNRFLYHYCDVIMGAMGCQITSLTIVYSTQLHSGANQKNIKAPRHWPLWPVTGELLAPMASNAEHVSIWWRHHVYEQYSTTKKQEIWHWIYWFGHFQRLMSCELRIGALVNTFGEKYRCGEHTLFHIPLPVAPNFDNNHKGNGLYE